MTPTDAIKNTIAQVLLARRNAIAELESGWTTAEEQAGINGIKSMPIDAWVKEGHDKVATGKLAESWVKNYLARGQLWLNSIADLASMPEAERVANIEATAHGVATDIKKIAKAGKQTVDKTVEVVGKTATALPWILGGAAVLFLLMQTSKRKT